jgi:hypothetical protein
LKLLRQAQNFFKHAGKDRNAGFKFMFGATKFYLFDAAHLLHQLTGRLTPETNGFIAWFLVENARLFTLDDTPQLQSIGRLAKHVNPADFEAILWVIDNFKGEVNE